MRKFMAIVTLAGVSGLMAGCCFDPCAPCCPAPVYRSPCCPVPSGGIAGTPGAAKAAPAGGPSAPAPSCGSACGGGGKSCG
jgi:hypothetical protein